MNFTAPSLSHKTLEHPTTAASTTLYLRRRRRPSGGNKWRLTGERDMVQARMSMGTWLQTIPKDPKRSPNVPWFWEFCGFP